MKKKDDEYISIDFKKIINYKHNPLIILLALGLIFNIYYFNTNKAVWWDEAEYLSFAKHFGSGVQYSMADSRAINYPIMLFLFSKIFSSSEIALRFFLMVLSLGTITACYFFSKKAFNKKIAFMATILLLTNYLYLFFQIRFLTEIPSLMFMLIGLYFFIERKNNKDNVLSGLFIGLSIATRFTSFFILIPMIIYQILRKEKLNDYLWLLCVMLGFIPTIIFDLIRGITPLSELIYMFLFNQENAKNNPFYFINQSLSIFGALSIPFFIFGLITMFLRRKNKKSEFLNLALIFIFFIIHFSFYSILSAWKEDRYMINLLPFYYCITAFGINDFFNLFLKKIKNNYKKIIISIIIFIIAFQNIQIGNYSIMGKAYSYIQVKEISEFAKNILPFGSKIITNAPPQISYYAEKDVLGLPRKIDDLYELLDNEKNANLIILSVFEWVPEYVKEFGSENFTIINASFIQNQPVVIAILYNRN